jgi:hypothetical protein
MSWNNRKLGLTRTSKRHSTVLVSFRPGQEGAGVQTGVQPELSTTMGKVQEILGAATAQGNAAAGCLRQGLQEVIDFLLQQSLAKAAGEGSGTGASATAEATVPGKGVVTQPVPGAELSQQGKEEAAQAAADFAEQKRQGQLNVRKPDWLERLRLQLPRPGGR